jgi:LCP family protein required for cell wall assembly
MFAKKNIEVVTGIPVNYVLVLDFSSFKEIVDALGGIVVNVDTSFTDSLYPIEGKENDLCDGDKEFKCRYETIDFEKGEILMNGETALKFVRSRNGDNEENTDIAREVRQQKVISAIKNKILSKKVILNPIRTIKLWNAAKKYIETDMDFYAAMVLAKRLLEIDGGITSSTIPEELLLNPPKLQKYDYQYVFVPRSGNWDEIKNWVKETFKN